MKVKPFFTDEQLKSVYMSKSQDSKCLECGLFKTCKSPKMPITGEGRKKCLIVAEAPGEEEDFQNTQLVGRAGSLLRGRLEERGLDLDLDFWKTNALACRPPNNREPKLRELKFCRNNYLDFIDEVKPEFIWLFGEKAIESCFMGRLRSDDEEESDLSPSRMRALCIPDSYSKAWVISQYHPSYALRNEGNPLIQSQFNRDLDFAISCFSKKPFVFPSIYDKIRILKDFHQICVLLDKLIKSPPEYLVFDYETTGLKPYNRGHKIVVVSVCFNINEAFSFILEHPLLTSEQQKVVKEKWGKILESKSKKAAHGMKFEDVWSRIILNVTPLNWHWCTMITSHTLDNRRGFTGLKFQAFIRWGIDDYGSDVRPFLKAKKGSEFNRIFDAPLDKLLLYGGIDALLTFWLLLDQKKEIPSSLVKPNNFYLNGALALGDIEINGIPADKRFYEETNRELENKMVNIIKRIHSSDEAKLYKKLRRRDIRLTADDDLRDLFFNILQLPIKKRTPPSGRFPQGQPSVDAEVIRTLDSNICKDLSKFNKLDKVKGTYIGQILRHISEDGRIHPSFGLHIPVTYRSCVAKGTKILAARDFLKYPEGVPIEKIKRGDFVYSFDLNLKPTLRKVLWAGKTGFKKVIRIHWLAARGRGGYLDVTPEHHIRLLDGSYIEAQNLVGDFRKPFDSPRKCKIQVLSGHRKRGALYFTNAAGLKEQRFLYKHFCGEISEGEIIHHKNRNHLDHRIVNLEKVSRSEHSKIHCTFQRKEVRENNKKKIKQLAENGFYKQIAKRGEENPNYLGLSKITCIRWLAKVKGKFSDNVPYDFGTFKKYLRKHNINPEIVKLRYDKKGNYIFKKKIKFLMKELGIEGARKILGKGYYSLRKLCSFYNIDFERRWGNRYGPFVPQNHKITKIEKLDIFVDVYDLEIEGTNNFIANEICVHNSCSDPNFQNIPVRDKEAKRYTRSGIIPSKGNIILDCDYCLARGTKIETIEGARSIEGIISDLEKGPVYVYCYNGHKQRIGISEVIKGSLIKKRAKVIEVGIDNGKSVVCTPEHKFMLRDGSYKEARYLNKGDSLMPFYTSKVNLGSKKKNIKVFYQRIHLNNGRKELAHNLISEDVLGKVIRKSKYVVHHIDGNGLNNSLNNLSIVTREKHMKIHAIQSWKTPKKKRTFAWVRSKEGRDSMSERSRKWWDSLTEEERIEFGKRVSKTMKDQKIGVGKNNTMCGRRHTEETKKKIALTKKKQQIKSFLGRKHTEETKEKISKANKGRISTRKGKKFGPLSKNMKRRLSKILKGKIPWNKGKHLSEDHKRKLTKAYRESKSKENHKVLFVRNKKYRNVYSISIKDTHNYALNAGIIVKNSSMEVRIIACASRDSFLIRMIEENRDVHKEEAMNIFCLDPSNVHKELRFHSKNGFVFPEFYGSYYENCAKNLWHVCREFHLKTQEGDNIFRHLSQQGISDYDRFEKHVKFIESDFWSKYKGVKKWQEKTFDFYGKNGYILQSTGFRLGGYMSRNDMLNYPIQGPAFHCLLYSLIHIGNEISSNMGTKIIGEIHDNLLFDCVPEEKEEIKKISTYIATEQIRKDWPWLIVPLELEWEETGVDQSWDSKKEVREEE